MPTSSFAGRDYRQAAKHLETLRRPIRITQRAHAWIMQGMLASISLVLSGRPVIERAAMSRISPAVSAAEAGLNATAAIVVAELNTAQRVMEFSGDLDQWLRVRQYRNTLRHVNRLIESNQHSSGLIQIRSLVERALTLDHTYLDKWHTGVREFRSRANVSRTVDHPRLRTYEGGSHEEWMEAALRDPESQRWMAWFQELAQLASERISRLTEAGELLDNLNERSGRTQA